MNIPAASRSALPVINNAKAPGLRFAAQDNTAKSHFTFTPRDFFKAMAKHVLKGNFAYLKATGAYVASLARLKASRAEMEKKSHVDIASLREFLGVLQDSAEAARNVAVSLGLDGKKITVGEGFAALFASVGGKTEFDLATSDKEIFGKFMDELRERAKASGIQSKQGSVDADFEGLKKASRLTTNFEESIALVRAARESLF